MRILTLLLLVLSFQVFALVDYTDKEEAKHLPFKNVPKASNAKPNTIKNEISTKKASRVSNQTWSLGLGAESISVRMGSVYSKVFKQNMSAVWGVGKNLDLLFSYWQVSTQDFITSSNVNRGNPGLKARFNWLRWGNASERATLDLFGSFTYRMINSDYASSRNDKSVGIETSKRFGRFAIAFEYEYIFTGTPAKTKEMNVGDIQKIAAGLGWVVSSDISFVLEGGTYKIAKSKLGGTSRDSLASNVSFGIVSPQLQLNLSRSISLEMGGVFRTNRLENSDKFLNAKLWDHSGSYGNSIYANLKMII